MFIYTHPIAKAYCTDRLRQMKIGESSGAGGFGERADLRRFDAAQRRHATFDADVNDDRIDPTVTDD